MTQVLFCCSALCEIQCCKTSLCVIGTAYYEYSL